ncbi:hypothetical protein [Clostridium massiliodielmoense]|uniref:hypothetical protein n=1 Tax=Clostridium massiliodielmoense TaxID=1776385 RepID=UPI0004D51978|nr:hypothetical protein [Clostridium massiliodielmoense]KEH96114.1 hypothetical protein Z962_07480 [Clostridium botulinum C/D str. BKT12695]
MIIYVNLIANENDEPALRVISAKNEKEELMINDISLTTGFGVFKANNLLRVIAPGIDVKFENFTQYNKLIQDVNDSLKAR